MCHPLCLLVLYHFWDYSKKRRRGELKHAGQTFWQFALDDLRVVRTPCCIEISNCYYSYHLKGNLVLVPLDDRSESGPSQLIMTKEAAPKKTEDKQPAQQENTENKDNTDKKEEEQPTPLEILLFLLFPCQRIAKTKINAIPPATYNPKKED